LQQQQFYKRKFQTFSSLMRGGRLQELPNIHVVI